MNTTKCKLRDDYGVAADEIRILPISRTCQVRVSRKTYTELMVARIEYNRTMPQVEELSLPKWGELIKFVS